RRTAALAAVSAAARLPSWNRRPASPGSTVPVGESDIDPPDRPRRQTLGAASSVTRWKVVVRAQMDGAAEHSRLLEAFAHLHVAFEQGKARPRIGGAIDVGVDVALE